MLSFNGDVVLKQKILSDLKNKVDQADIWQRDIVSWNGTTGSFVGHIIHSEDLADWEKLGLPKWLAITLDYFFVTALSLDDGKRIGIELIEAIPVGSSLHGLGNDYLVALFNQDEVGLRQIATNVDILQAIDLLIESQTQAGLQKTVTAAQWRKLRTTLTELTNQFEEGSLNYRIASCIEAAAWNPQSSRTVIADTVRAWSSVQGHFVVSQYWTDEHDAHIRNRLQQLYDQKKAEQDNDDFINVFELLDQQYPEEAQHLKQHNRRQAEQSSKFWKASSTLLQQQLAQIN